MTLVTQTTLTGDLERLGLTDSTTLLVHTSLSRLGTVVGGPQTVVEALLAAVGPRGTVVMPTQSWQLCDPAVLHDPDVPVDAWPIVRANLPIFDPATTPSRTMGAVAELFRTRPGAVRSPHPHRSFTALGPAASALMAVHDLDDPNGERSPLRVMYEADAEVLLLGVPYAKATMLHLAEHRSGTLHHTERNGAPLLVDGQRTWVEYDELVVDDGDFDAVGADLEATTDLVRRGTVGDAPARLVSARALVDHAAAWFAAHRRHPQN